MRHFKWKYIQYYHVLYIHIQPKSCWDCWDIRILTVDTYAYIYILYNHPNIIVFKIGMHVTSNRISKVSDIPGSTLAPLAQTIVDGYYREVEVVDSGFPQGFFHCLAG